MSATLVLEIEKLVRGGESVHGEIPWATLGEIADRLASNDGVLAWEISADRDAHGRPRCRLGMHGTLALVCQRCLAPLAFRLEHAHQLVVVKDEAELPELEEEDDETDFIVVPGLLDIRSVVLEELLLVLPMMPRHEQADCHGPKEETGDSARVSPFAILRQSGGS